jgi:hypothetical protein
LPALAELSRAAEIDKAVADELARSERFDRAVSTAMHDVPLPAGLLERLEARLAGADVTNTDSTGDVALPPHPPRFSRRTVLISTGLATAAALLLAVASQFWSSPSRSIPSDQLAAAVSQWIERSAVTSPAWEKAALPVPNVLAVPVKSKRQQTFTTANGESATVFDLTPGLGQQVLLFVVKTPHTYPVRTSPYTKLTGVSSGMAVAAWQRGDKLYVLAVREDGQSLDHFIREQPLALRHGCLPAARPA